MWLMKNKEREEQIHVAEEQLYNSLAIPIINLNVSLQTDEQMEYFFWFHKTKLKLYILSKQHISPLV